MGYHESGKTWVPTAYTYYTANFHCGCQNMCIEFLQDYHILRFAALYNFNFDTLFM